MTVTNIDIYKYDKTVESEYSWTTAEALLAPENRLV